MILNKNKDATAYLSEAYLTELESIQATAKMLETPESLIRKEQTARTLALAEKVVDRGILNAETTEQYVAVLKKIEEKQQDIKKFYGIDVTTDGLTAIRNAHLALVRQFTEELQAEAQTFSEKLNQQEQDTQEQLAQNKLETDEKIATIQQKKQELEKEYRQSAVRENEQYTYDLKRARKQEMEERKRAVSEREFAMSLKKKEAEDAKQECLDRLQEISEMEIKVENIPKLIEQAKQESASAREKELNKEYGYHKMLDEKDNQNKISELQAEFDRLEKKYNALLAEKEELSAKLDKCNAQSRELTSDTVRSIGGINILNTDNNNTGKK